MPKTDERRVFPPACHACGVQMEDVTSWAACVLGIVEVACVPCKVAVCVPRPTDWPNEHLTPESTAEFRRQMGWDQCLR